jgi:phosphonate degradation associated HDIG domain protein
MRELSTVDDLFDLYATRGSRHYGEGVTQRDHALQCAALARSDGVHDALVVAALLHDVGHLVLDGADDELSGLVRDDRHEALGARLLAPLFGARVSQPVALHVIAKRWLCTNEPHYYGQLSPASQSSLMGQGGLLSEEECRRFEAHHGFNDAIALRTWDDAGKVEGVPVGDFREWEPLVRSLAGPQ